MKPIIDLNKEYGLVFDGGGARGAYQIGAWRALSEAGVKVSAVAGTSVGALNGALVCMGDLEKAGHIWKEMAFSRVMDVDDELMEQFFNGEASIREILKGLWKKLADGGIDITPLKELIHEVVDEEKIRKCGKEFCLLTFSVSDMKELLKIYRKVFWRIFFLPAHICLDLKMNRCTARHILMVVRSIMCQPRLF